MKFYHVNHNVADLDRSSNFYKEHFGMTRIDGYELGDMQLVFLGFEPGNAVLELTWLENRNLNGDVLDFYKGQTDLSSVDSVKKPFHMAFFSNDFETDLAKHKAAGIVVEEELEVGIYFVKDPDGYLIEIANGANYDQP